MTNTQRIPIRYNGASTDQIIIECEIYSVDGSYSRIFGLVMDTGVTISGINKYVAMQLGYDPLEPQYFLDVHTAGGIEEKLPIIEISMIRVDGLKLEKPKFLCNKYFDDIDICGVIGLDFLAQYNLKINFDEALLEIDKRKEIIITP